MDPADSENAIAPSTPDGAAAREEHARLLAMLSKMDIGILLVSPGNRVTYGNPAFSRIWTIPPDTHIVGADPVALLAASGSALARPAELTRHLLQLPLPGEPLIAFELPMADGRMVTQQSHEVVDAQGQAIGRMWLFEDVTTERRNADQLIYLAERDALTGLYNRRRFNEEMGRMVAEAQRGSSRVALMFLDLDGFKYINDTFGHRAGDAMLIRVASEVGRQVRRNEIFARLGGDEFAILVPDISEQMLQIVAERITRSIAQVRFEFEGQSLRLTCSCGIAVYPEHARNTEDLMARADAAMYQAKESGKNAWRIYRAGIDESRLMVTQMPWNERITHAMENNLMELYFQGIYSIKDRELVHFEALLRMRDQHNPETVILPGEFIPVAEKSGKILDIDRWVISQSIKLLSEVGAIPALAVNISGRSLDDLTLPQFIGDELRRMAVPAQRLKVELTETAAVSDLHDARRFIEALQQIGCGVCLDDFGTGVSSFAYLKHLPVDTLKIDGLFIRALPQDLDNQLFVKAMVSIARGLHKTTIAECVEDEETLQLLATFGVDYVQGYHLEKPRSNPPLIETGRNRHRALGLQPKP